MKITGRSALPWILVVALAAALAIVLAARRSPASHAGTAGGTATPVAPGTRKVIYWVDPMVPGYKSDKPGKSPFMDMDLVPVYEDGGTPSASVPGVPGYAGISLSPERQQAIGVRLGKA